MKKKQFLAVLPAFMLLSCGGGSETNVESGEVENSESSYQSSFGECAASSSSIEYFEATNEKDSVALRNFNGIDLSTLKSASAELTEKHNNLYIKFATSDDVLDKTPSKYSNEDHYVSITVQNKNGELEAGEYSKEGTANNAEVNIMVVHRLLDDGVGTSLTLGNNHVTQHATINELSEKHVCGTYAMKNKEGDVLISSTFDLDVKMVKF